MLRDEGRLMRYEVEELMKKIMDPDPAKLCESFGSGSATLVSLVETFNNTKSPT